jgi:hypothetical protein
MISFQNRKLRKRMDLKLVPGFYKSLKPNSYSEEHEEAREALSEKKQHTATSKPFRGGVRLINIKASRNGQQHHELHG